MRIGGSTGAFGGLAAKQEMAEGRRPCHGENEGGQQSRADGDSQGAKERPGDAGNGDQRDEDDDRSDGGSDKGDGDFAEGASNRVAATLPGIAMEHDIFDDHDGVVDDESHGCSESAKRHEVEALTD